MNKRTAKALEESIEKWRQIERGEMADTGENCSLCMEFLDYDHWGNCKGCPVYEKTGQRLCNDTPYDDWRDAHSSNFYGDILVADTEKRVQIARRERKFLESLRDKK